jgi:hypothetical protein
MLHQSFSVAIGLGALAFSGAGSADSVRIGLNATVVPVCRFYSAFPVINIVNSGTGRATDLDRAGPAIGDTAITYGCSQGTVPTFAVAATAIVLCPSCPAESSIATAISLSDSGVGQGMAPARHRTLTVTGRVAQKSYPNALLGAYSGPVTITVAP